MDWDFIWLLLFCLAMGGIEVFFNWRRCCWKTKVDQTRRDIILGMMEHRMTGHMPTPEEMAERRKGNTNGSCRTPVDHPPPAEETADPRDR